MSLFAIVLVLLLEQFHAIPARRLARAWFIDLSAKLKQRFNDGEYQQGVLAWLLLAALPSICVLIASTVLWWNSPWWAFALSFGVLYFTMGLRHFGNQFTALLHALQFAEIERARSLLAEWTEQSADRLTPTEVAGQAIARGLSDTHQYLFAPIFWFVVLGPAGALMYRVAQLLDASWGQSWRANRGGVQGSLDADPGRFGEFTHQTFFVIDWIPARLTGAALALAGDFEDAAQCWRTQLGQSPTIYQEIVLAAGAGALSVRLNVPTATAFAPVGDEASVVEFGLGDEPDSNVMQRAAALVWRTLLFILVLLAVIWLSTFHKFFNFF
ncbi:MAG: regulatory signaling modulator protein AmpE [Rhodocyclaceae bacterium]|nr:regulatory signaling modulator protein AmpE [Rhodocyclaceae bacterium]